MSSTSFAKKTFKSIKGSAQKALHRSLDQHVKLAVTGLSGSGKTAFITALVKHLTTQSDDKNLPFFDVMREHRHIATKVVPQEALKVPTFDYPRALNALLPSDGEPTWPASTERINTLRLAIKYQSASGLRGHFSPQSTLYLDIIDYPGEWLLDLPMLEQSYSQWCEQQYPLLLHYPRVNASTEFINALEQLDLNAPVDESLLARIAALYQSMLVGLKKDTKLAMLQPGRMLMPGDLQGAPLLLFFPVNAQHIKSDEVVPGSNLAHLIKRFNAYVKEVVKPFYNEHFKHFDRQIVLVDVLSALNEGHETLQEQSSVINQLLAHFNYGESGFFKRLFKPNIDKILFAANKSDHISAKHHKDLALLLDSLVHEQSNHLKFDGVQIETMAMSSIAATQPRQVADKGQTLDCIYGKPLNEQDWLTYLPPQPPKRMLNKNEWPAQGFEFLSFSPMPNPDKQLKHIRLDHVMQYLLGDKLS
ncbi:nucleoside triphosphate hydrolase [Pseudoalteromonas sp. S3785]|uniref:YcjX family protein n=1 Tax=Pseudoalteromonas sp. S3785 TaxID=579545 RepID=UPI00110A2855|nr:YcjX family protein [Pseudoalteromonas sp. S3785]TMO76655.1 nucleoside triphosphate hydrolase [Pseudoalteromonas sp. S3785]